MKQKEDFRINGAEDLLAIDTTGLQDTNGKDKYYLAKMANYVNNINSLNRIIIF